MARILSYLSGFTTKFWLALVVVLLACLPLAYCKGRADGKAIERAAWERSIAKQKARADDATIKAADTRATDTERNKADDKARTDAARDGGRHAANCERLRQAGLDAAAAGC